jgi:hypothetical protein
MREFEGIALRRLDELAVLAVQLVAMARQTSTSLTRAESQRILLACHDCSGSRYSSACVVQISGFVAGLGLVMAIKRHQKIETTRSHEVSSIEQTVIF